MLPSQPQEERLDCNQLHRSVNPYLWQHADNPVHWQEWSSRILEVATGLKRPLFISIGYSTCHWCHVMEEESFSDPAIAEILNRYFIPIKIDREERPDLDTYYMNSAHFMGVSGGWPLNIFADSTGVPFWITTYLPPVSRHGLPSFMEVISTLGEEWEQASEKIMIQTAKNGEFMKGFFAAEIGEAEENDLKEDFFMKQQEFLEYHERFFDKEQGGFKFQPRVKFPHMMGLIHLLEIAMYQFYHNRDPLPTLGMAVKSILSLIRGGIYDHLGGGLFRYSTDYEWGIPHFEKMLYDNALFIELLCDAYRVSRTLSESPHLASRWTEMLKEYYPQPTGAEEVPEFASEIKTALEKTIGYWNQEMSSAVEGKRVFFSAQDAGNKESEGVFYVWTGKELEEALTSEERKVFLNYFYPRVFSRSQGTYHLMKKSSPLKRDEAIGIKEMEKKLFKLRAQREMPLKDHKILVSWNALLAYSYLHVYEVFGSADCRDRGLEILAFLEEVTMEGELLKHGVIVEEGKMKSSPTWGFLSDYAQLCRTQLKAYRVTGKSEYLKRCRRNMDTILKYFYKNGSFSEINPQHHDTPIATLIEAHDGVEPGSQSVLAEVFLHLEDFYPGAFYEKAESIFRKFYKDIGKQGLPYMTRAFYYYQNNSTLISLYGEEEDTNYLSLKKYLGERYFPATFLLLNPEVLPAKKKPEVKKAHAVICHQQTCSQPLFDVESVEAYINDFYGK